MKRLGMATVMLGLLAAACPAGTGSLGSAPSAPVPSAPVPGSGGSKNPPSPSPEPSSTPSGTIDSSFTYQVWFGLNGRLFLTRRRSPATLAVGRTALQGLLDGPTDPERGAGLSSAVPIGTRLLGLSISGGLATVDLSSEFRPGGGDPSALSVAEVVYTISQFSTVHDVVLRVNGADLFETPQTRSGYASLLPAILVETPIVGATVASPATVAGTANVFEATVSLRILDAAGREIAQTFTTATCGTGCRGSFSAAVPFRVTARQSGMIEAFESSAKDGSPINLVRIPVTLTP